MKYFIKTIVILFLFKASSLNGQTVLDEYIKEALNNNLVLKQKSLNFSKASYALKIANSYFLPSINFNVNYTSGEGGRSISLPVGDLLNPVYKTLNQLTNSNAFPKIENVNETLFPNDFYDFKLRATVPIFNFDLIINRTIQSRQKDIAEFEIDVYKKELIKEIKIAYFNYLSAESAISIYDNALFLANEAKRINESLIKNGFSLSVYLLRSEGEIENIITKKIEAQNQLLSTKYYFNFLLNKDLNCNIEQDSIVIHQIDLKASNSQPNFWVNEKEEFLILQEVAKINQAQIDLNKKYWIPKIGAFLDIGAQGQNWNYNSKSKYYLFGIQLEVPIFEAFRNNYKIEEASLDLKNTELALQLFTNKTMVKVNSSYNLLQVAYQNYQSSLKHFSVAKAYYKLISKGYNEGVNTFLESVDARSQLLNSEITLNLSKYQIFIAKASLEREISLIKN